VTDDNYGLVLRAFQNYGHYLTSEEHESVMRFLSEATTSEDGTGLRVPNLNACLPLISAKRDKLKARLEALTAKRYGYEILRWMLIGIAMASVVSMILSALGT
jgi:hypothetical protein